MTSKHLQRDFFPTSFNIPFDIVQNVQPSKVREFRSNSGHFYYLELKKYIFKNGKNNQKLQVMEKCGKICIPTCRQVLHHKCKVDVSENVDNHKFNLFVIIHVIYAYTYIKYSTFIQSVKTIYD